MADLSVLEGALLGEPIEKMAQGKKDRVAIRRTHRRAVASDSLGQRDLIDKRCRKRHHGQTKCDGLTQADAAALCGVGARFLGETEQGKETAQVGKVLRILQGLGLELHIADIR